MYGVLTLNCNEEVATLRSDHYIIADFIYLMIIKLTISGAWVHLWNDHQDGHVCWFYPDQVGCSDQHREAGLLLRGIHYHGKV